MYTYLSGISVEKATMGGNIRMSVTLIQYPSAQLDLDVMQRFFALEMDRLHNRVEMSLTRIVQEKIEACCSEV